MEELIENLRSYCVKAAENTGLKNFTVGILVEITELFAYEADEDYDEEMLRDSLGLSSYDLEEEEMEDDDMGMDIVDPDEAIDEIMLNLRDVLEVINPELTEDIKVCQDIHDMLYRYTQHRDRFRLN